MAVLEAGGSAVDVMSALALARNRRLTTALHYTQLHYTLLHYTTALHTTALHTTALHTTALHNCTTHYCTTLLHYTMYTAVHVLDVLDGECIACYKRRTRR